MNINNPLNLAQDTATTMRKVSDDMMSSADKAFESTREHSNQALDRAESKFRELRGSVDPMIEMLTSKAQKMARQSLDLAAEAKERAEKSFMQAADSTTRYVSKQPMRSVLIAAAVGAAVALLVSTLRHRNHNHKRNRY